MTSLPNRYKKANSTQEIHSQKFSNVITSTTNTQIHKQLQVGVRRPPFVKTLTAPIGSSCQLLYKKLIKCKLKLLEISENISISAKKYFFLHVFLYTILTSCIGHSMFSIYTTLIHKEVGFD